MVRITIISLFFVGCASHTSQVCPAFPIPKQEVLDILNNLNNSVVDSWVTDLYKLNLKLNIGGS